MFWYLVKSDLRYCTRVLWTSHFLQGTKITLPCITGHPVACNLSLKKNDFSFQRLDEALEDLDKAATTLPDNEKIKKDRDNLKTLLESEHSTGAESENE